MVFHLLHNCLMFDVFVPENILLGQSRWRKLPWQNRLFKIGWLVVSWFLCIDSIQHVLHRPTAWANWLAWAPRSYLLGCHGLQYNLLINGVYWGYNPLILILLPAPCWDIQPIIFCWGKNPLDSFTTALMNIPTKASRLFFSMRRWDVERHHPLHAGTNGNLMEHLSSAVHFT